MAKTIVVINRHKIAANKKNGTMEPVISVRKGRSGKPSYVSEFDISDGKLIYSPDHPLKCGATVWIECT